MVLAGRDREAHQMVEHNEYGSDVPRYARAFDLTVPHVCPDCNHHWMSDMESRTRDLVLALVLDKKMSLEAGEQHTVSRPGAFSKC